VAPQTADAEPHASAPPRGWSVFQRRLALSLLIVSGILNLVDRQIVSILIEPIKHEFGLSDTKIGLLTGLAFALCYAVVAFPVGRLLDTRSRRSIFAGCIALWSACTMAAGLAASFPMLLLTRLGVAVGESCASPAQQSIAADLYPGASLARALALINMGSALGVGLSLLLGGWLSEEFGWRAAFIAVGAPGLILALAIRFALPEPPRRTAEGVETRHVREPLAVAIAGLWQLRSYRLILLAKTAASFSGFALLAWAPSMMIRIHHLSPVEVGLWFGLMTGLGYGLGSIVSGELCTRLGKRDIRWYLRVGGAFNLVAAPAGLLIALSPSPAVAIGAMFVQTFSSTIATPAVLTMVQMLIGPTRRGLAAATTGFVQVVGGVGLGPFVMGVLNDAFGASRDPEGMRLALVCVMIGVAIAGPLLFWANRFVPREYARAAGREEPSAGAGEALAARAEAPSTTG